MINGKILKNQKPKIAYMCSYIPGELIRRLGFDAVSFFDIEADYPDTSGVFPVTLCSYVRYCAEIINRHPVDGIVFANCCNGMQRLYDYVKIKRPELYSFMLDLPRTDGTLDGAFYIDNIENLIISLCDHFSMPYPDNLKIDMPGADNAPETLKDNTVYVLGSAISAGTHRLLEECFADLDIKINRCGDRENHACLTLSPDHSGMPDRNPAVPWMDNSPCARTSSFSDWFEDFVLRNHSRLAGIIYVSSQHCDNHLFRYPSVWDTCKKHRLPVLSLEETYLPTALNRLLTRLEAFRETLTFHKNFQAAPDKHTETASLGNGDKNSAGSFNTFRQRMRLVRGILPGMALDATRKVIANQIELFTGTIWERPRDIVWTNMVMTVEVFYAADLLPVNTELVAGWLASLGLSREFIARSEGMGFSPNLCSYHKATMGLLDDGGLPHPRGAVMSSHICDGGPGVAYYLARRYNTDIFILNVPYFNGPASLEYVLQQYKKLILWVENYTGRPFSMDRLAESLELSNRARQYWMMALDLRKQSPVFPGYLSLRNLFGVSFLFGSELGVEITKSYYDQLLTMNETKQNITPDKSVRLLWIHFAPLYNNKIMEYLEKELDCWIVYDITGYIYWDEYDTARPLESLADKSLSHFYMGDVAERRELYRRLIEEYDINGIVHFMHAGCRAIPGSSWLVRDIASEMKIPYLELTGDCIDPRGFSEEQVRVRFDAFKETLRRCVFVSRR